MTSLAPQDRCSQDKQIELVNIIGDPGARMLTRAMAMAKEHNAASAHKCLFVDFLSEEEPKKVTEALKHPGWVDAIQEELKQFAKKSMDIVYQMDIKSSFLNGKLKEEVYAKQPLGFESSEFSNYVCKLDKALYGLKQAPRACPDIQFLTCLYVRYQANSKESHLIAVKRIFKYLKDSDYAGCNMDKKSTSGACQLLGGKLVCWSTKKQKSVAMSSTDAEYVASARCCANILWMKSQLTNYDIIYEKVPIFCDNTSAIEISNNPVLRSRTKHIDIEYHFIRDHIMKGDIELYFIPNQYQLVDIFTKRLDEPTFKSLMVELDLLNIDDTKDEPLNGLLLWPTVEENGVTRSKKSSELSTTEDIQADCDERIQMLMQGMSLTKQERKCKLYDEFDKFAYRKGESLRDFYLRFSLLLNDMNIYNMKLEQFQVNIKFLNTLPPE
nr:retrovirus-related Pol polyprotein from transposon TNT 1-94 [Tanacetum cinerariifolium]